MDGVREYLVGVAAAAILCGTVNSLIGTKGTVGVTIKLLSGLLMLLAVIRPLTTISVDGFFSWTEDINADGMDIAASGELLAEDAYKDCIIKQTEAYILEEAKALGCDLTVEVVLADGDTPVPYRVRIAGEISPYAKQKLTTILSDTLGIQREEQIWT